MFRSMAVVGILALLLTACEQQQTEPVATAPPPSPTAAPPEAEERTAAEPTEAERDTVAGQEPAAEEPTTAMQEEQPAQQDTQEFHGQSPTFNGAPESVTLEAKNGNITFNHQAHSQLTDCQTCHGEGTPGAIELGRDRGHELCMGCHKEMGAGPVKCAECHVRS